MASEGLVDDATIADDSELWRRIHPDWIVPNQNIHGLRVSSAAFDNSKDGSPTSVLMADLVQETGRDAQNVLAGFEGYALASITAGQARHCNQGVARDPLPEEPAHAYIFGEKKKTIKRCLAQHAEWVVSPA